MRKPAPFIAAVLAGLALAGVGCSASADDTVSWKNPTQYTDGTALNPADIDGTIIRWGDKPDPDTVDSVKAPGAVTTFVVARDDTPGTRCYQVSTLMKAGGQSGYAPASWVCKTIAPPVAKKPKVPTQLTVK